MNRKPWCQENEMEMLHKINVELRKEVDFLERQRILANTFIDERCVRIHQLEDEVKR